MIKYAELEVLSAHLAPGQQMRIQPRGQKTATSANGVVFKTAHRHDFQYEPEPGFLYVRSRAISSRCNDNFDEFPAEEIKMAYRSFIGKPVFVNHVNDNHRRARGVIIDAALHEDLNEDGSPDTWVEVLMKVDAVNFPMLARAILAGEIDRTSMGADVKYSICSFCGNKAAAPHQYCSHIKRMKGQWAERKMASGTRERIRIREICYGLNFFENSLLVEQPADPTAFTLGVDDHSRTVTASASSFVPLPAADGSPVLYDLGLPKTASVSVSSGYDSRIGYCQLCQRETLQVIDGERVSCARCGTVDPDDPFSNLDTLVAKKKRPWLRPRLAYGEQKAPAEIDTLRDETCPVCGEDDAYDGGKCAVCGFIKPPDEFMDPDLDRAKEVDLRQTDQAIDNSEDDRDGKGNLKCDNCGATFSSEEDHEHEEEPEEKPEEEPEKKPKEKTAAGAADLNSPFDNSMPHPKNPEGATDAEQKGPKEKDVETAPKSGDSCPTCGEGTLQPVKEEKSPDEEVEDRPENKDEKKDDSQQDGKGKPPWLKEKSAQKEQSMRPALKALLDQQKIINRHSTEMAELRQVVALLAKNAKFTRHPKVARLIQAAEENPAQPEGFANPTANPATEAPAATTEEARQPDATDDVTNLGATPATDVSPDAATSVDSTETLLNPAPDLNEENVTAPVEGTTEQPPLSETKGESDVTAETGDNTNPMFPLQGPFAEKATTGRFVASLRLARLRLKAGIEAGDDDLSIAEKISSSEVTDETIQNEIEVLTKVDGQARKVASTKGRGPLQSEGVSRMVPSLQSMGSTPPADKVYPEVTSDEVLW